IRYAGMVYARGRGFAHVCWAARLRGYQLCPKALNSRGAAATNPRQRLRHAQLACSVRCLLECCSGALPVASPPRTANHAVSNSDHDADNGNEGFESSRWKETKTGRTTTSRERGRIRSKNRPSSDRGSYSPV